MMRAALQEDVCVGEAEHGRVLVFVLQGHSENPLIERLRALQVADNQVDGADLFLPFSHVTPLPIHAWANPVGMLDRSVSHNSSSRRRALRLVRRSSGLTHADIGI